MKSARVVAYGSGYSLTALYAEGRVLIHLKGLPVDPAGVIVKSHVGLIDGECGIIGQQLM